MDKATPNEKISKSTGQQNNFSEEQNIVEAYIRELFREGGKWRSQKKIADAINLKHETRFVQTTILRALHKMKARKVDGAWSLEPDVEQNMKISDLKKFMKVAIDSDTDLIKNPEIYILKTKPSHNTLLAKKIREVFKNEIYSIICPNTRDIIIFYDGEPCKNKSDGNDFEKTIIEMLEDC